MKKETVKLTKGAMQLVDDQCFATVKFAEGAEGEKKPQLEMLAYSGGIIKGHWYWGDLAIDLEGMSFPKKKFPLLEDHDTSKKLGFIKKLSIENNQLTVTDAEFLDTPESLKFRETSAQGFPYEASIYAKPTQIQRLTEDETAEVNGYTMKGPGTIWRKSIFKESSVCTFGYDSNTKSVAMSETEDVTIEYGERSGEETQLNNKEDLPKMDLEKFKSEYPEEFSKLQAQITDAVTAQFSVEKKQLEDKLTAAAEANAQLSAENKDSEKRLIALEKAESQRIEQGIKLSADNLFAEKFKEAGLPDRIQDKVRRLVGHEQFVADGVFDTEAFAAAVDAELKDWSGATEGAVIGFSTSTKTPADNNSATKLTDDVAARMASYLK